MPETAPCEKFAATAATTVTARGAGSGFVAAEHDLRPSWTELAPRVVSPLVVIDDDEGSRIALDRVIDASYGLQLVRAAARGAVTRLADLLGIPPEGVIVDPAGEGGVSGAPLIEQIRAAWPTARVFVYTGDLAVVDSCLAAGADVAVHKDTQPGILTALVGMSLAQGPI